jgi:hypothetical protein
MKTCVKNRNSIKNNNAFMDSHHINNDIDCGTKLCNTSKKHFDTHQIDLEVKDVKIQCNNFKIYEPKPLYIYELLVKCENAQQIENIKNNILKSSLILNETISKSIEEIEHQENMQGISHQKFKLKCKDFEKWNETLEFDNIHVGFSKCSKLNNYPNQYNHSHLIYKLVLECYEPLQIELIDCALFENTVVICSKIKINKKKYLVGTHSKEFNRKKINVQDIDIEEHTNKIKDIICPKSCIAKAFEKNVLNEDNNINENGPSERIEDNESDNSKHCIDEYNERPHFQKPKKIIKLKTHKKFMNKLYANIISDNLNKLKKLINTSIVNKPHNEDCCQHLKSNKRKNQIFNDYTSNLKPLNVVNENFKLNDSISTLLLPNDINEDRYDRKCKNTMVKNNVITSSLNFDTHNPSNNNANTLIENSIGTNKICFELPNIFNSKETNQSPFLQSDIVQLQLFEPSNEDLEHDNHMFNQPMVTKTCASRISLPKCMNDTKKLEKSFYHSNNNLDSNSNLKLNPKRDKTNDFNINVSNKHYDSIDCLKNDCEFQMSNKTNNKIPTTGKNSFWIHKKDKFNKNSSKIEVPNMLSCSVSSKDFDLLLNYKICDDFKHNQHDYLNSSNLDIKESINVLNKNSSEESHVKNNYKNYTLPISEAHKPISSLESQSSIEIVIQQPPIEDVDKNYEIDLNKEPITQQNDKTLYNNIFNNFHIMPIEINDCKDFNQFDTTKKDLQKYNIYGNINEDTMLLNPKVIEIVVDHPPIQEQFKIDSLTPYYQNSINANKFFNEYKSGFMVDKEIQTDLSGPQEDENVFCELDGYVCHKDDEIICKKKKKRKKNSSIFFLKAS